MALAAGIKGFYWIALILMFTRFVLTLTIFATTFFSVEALKPRKSNYKKYEMN
jgi:hypothetical protein